MQPAEQEQRPLNLTAALSFSATSPAIAKMCLNMYGGETVVSDSILFFYSDKTQPFLLKGTIDIRD